jgi:hypothetical protein
MLEDYARDWLSGYSERTTAGLRESTRDVHRRRIEGKAIPFL